MADASQRGWGDPGARDFRSRNIVKLQAGGISLLVHRDMAVIFGKFIGELTTRHHYRLDRGQPDDWGYAQRRIKGSTSWSNHAWGLAIDLNALTNPQGSVLRTDMPKDVGQLAARYGLRWGGNYQKRPDAMHFEFMGTRGQAAVLTQRLLGKGGDKRRNPYPPPNFQAHPIRLGDRGTEVKWVQWGVTVNQDGVFGPQTQAAVKRFQQSRGLGADGIVGPRTGAALAQVRR